MSERDDALKALQRLFDGAFLNSTDRGSPEDEEQDGRDEATLRAAIDLAYPPEANAKRMLSECNPPTALRAVRNWPRDWNT